MKTILSEKNSYRELVKDYFYDFMREVTREKYLDIYFGMMAILWPLIFSEGMGKFWYLAIPICFAVINGITHRLTLPFMLYLAPCSVEEREVYLQKMLYVKLAVPFLFGCLWDMGVALFYSLSGYAVFFQLLNVLWTTYIYGMLYDGAMMLTAVTRPVFGPMRGFAVLPIIFSYLCNVLTVGLCARVSDGKEFWGMLALLLVIMVPVTIPVRKHWKTIRRNFADYELATKIEVKR